MSSLPFRSPPQQTFSPLILYVSLAGPLRQSHHPDILEKIRQKLDLLEGIHAWWKVAPGRVDKTRQVYFQLDETLNISDIKGRIDRILQRQDHHHKGSYIHSNSHRIFYHFLKPESISALTHTPIFIDGQSYYPCRPRFIQPVYGLEIAIAGVGYLSQARSVIDNYIERTFGGDSSDPVKDPVRFQYSRPQNRQKYRLPIDHSNLTT